MIKVALIGNPNTGKTSLFNQLTGLNQKVGNYPGITVQKKIGSSTLTNGEKAKILDLPGTYSLNANSLDEKVVVDTLMDTNHADFPDVAVVVVDVENLKRNLLLFTQIKDLKLPTILAINMSDQMEKKGITLDIPALEANLGTKIALISAKNNQGITDLKKLIEDYKNLPKSANLDIDTSHFKSVISPSSDLKKQQHQETVKRYQFINNALKNTYKIDRSKATDLRSKLDKILTHKVFGYFIFFGILLFIFQLLFSWSEAPMNAIDGFFGASADWVKENLPEGMFTNLLADGIIAGLGGVVIFIPQIAFLFLFISILEESGYMSRVVFLMDKIMRRFGMSGKSVVPLISGTACAIPAVMATRNIESWKERLIAILVVPFVTCAARLPVYAILIALVIPKQTIGAIFNTQGLTLLGLYLLGFATALLSAYILNKRLKTDQKSYFVVEMPDYKMPLLKNVFINVYEKTKAFVVDAGKIILAISVVLWFMASYGPGDDFNNAESIVKSQHENLEGVALDDKIASYKLEHSYIGIVGKAIEPVIRPLGYDWKIGVGLVTSFAAREVFVGTLATIYSVESANENEDEDTIIQKMASERHKDGTKVFTFASGISLLLFYVFAMQCMSTLAIVKRETNSWKWPLLQFVAMTAIAYVAALVAFQFLK